MTDNLPQGNPSLTGIRGAAALWVYMFHFSLVSGSAAVPLPGWLVDIAAGGYLGVDLFFVLSGFILMSAHRHDFATMRAGRWLSFYSARAWRVYPPSLAALLFIALLFMVDEPLFAFAQARAGGALTAGSFVTTAALATRWGLPVAGSWNEPIWSLSVEILAYLAFPALAWLALHTRATWLIASAALLPPLLLLFIQHFEGGMSANMIDNPGPLFRVACGFVSGMFLYRLCSAERVRLGRVAGATGLASAVVMLVLLLCWGSHRNAIVLLFAGLLASCAYRSGPVYRVLSSNVMVFLGAISFPFYLLHLIVLVALSVAARAQDLRGLAYCLAAVAVTMLLIGLSYLGHVYVEKPAHRYAKRRSRWHDDAAGASRAAAQATG